MNTLWLKTASVVIGILILIVLITMFLPSGEKEPAPPQTPIEDNGPNNFQEQVQEDRNNYLSKPVPVETLSIEPNEPAQTTDVNMTQPVEIEPAPVQSQTREVTIYVKPLNEIEDMEAERLINAAVPGLDIGRLPMLGYSLFIQTSRQIISRWPESSYAFQCKRMYAALPERYQQRYNLTAEDMDISKFFKSRAGTVPVTVTIKGQ